MGNAYDNLLVVSLYDSKFSYDMQVGQMNNWVSCCQSCGKSSFAYAHMEAMPYLSVSL